MSDIAVRLEALRQLMRDNNVDFYYVPASDAHQNEYVPNAWQRRAWISGFTGSAGDVLVGQEQAYLWTDGRYFTQAELELTQDFTLMKRMQGQAAPIDVWLLEQAQPLRVGVDPAVVSAAEADRMQRALAVHGGSLVRTPTHWVDDIRDDKAPLPSAPVCFLDEAFTGESTKEKLERVRAAMSRVGADALALNMLDEIAWLFNLRGSDITYNPVFLSYALIEEDRATLFVQDDQHDDDLMRYLKAMGVELKSYHAFAAKLQAVSGCVWLDASSASLWMQDLCANVALHLERSPIVLFKACKNPVEQEGMRKAHRLDAIAEIRFFHWLSEHWQQGLTELDCVNQLAQFRLQEPLCVGMSFNTIAGFADHGAIIHYAVSEDSANVVDDSSLFLLDSGGQYLCGTTDITRTVHLGEPTKKQQHHYTLVLKGHLALARAVFANGVSGANLDALARQFLWQANLDYAHGTGHGVGCYLCVHEGPIAIRRAGASEPLLPGMVVSNEPGVYFPGEYGIRIENLLLVKQRDGLGDTGHGPFYYFEDLVLVPYARNLIDVDLLDAKEREQIDAFHKRVYETMAPELEAPVVAWLQEACAPLA